MYAVATEIERGTAIGGQSTKSCKKLIYLFEDDKDAGAVGRSVGQARQWVGNIGVYYRYVSVERGYQLL
jgi:hypothetical protein